MKKLKIILLVVVILLVAGIGAHVMYINTMTPTETYPYDTFLSTVTNKKALIITAHDDDAYTLSGTIFKLISGGWTIRHICLGEVGSEDYNLFVENAKKQKLEGVDFITMKYRNDLDTNSAPYMAIPRKEFAAVFNHDTVYNTIVRIIDNFQPAVIFSLDNDIGAYGHPDHVFFSQIAIEYCDSHKTLPGYSVQKIYQVVYPPSMAQEILVNKSRNRVNVYEEAKKVYGVDGMPVPDVSINIYPWAGDKKTYMDGFGEHARRNIKKFSPYFNYYPAWLYFKLFDKEYFRVIDVKA